MWKSLSHLGEVLFAAFYHTSFSLLSSERFLSRTPYSCQMACFSSSSATSSAPNEVQQPTSYKYDQSRRIEDPALDVLPFSEQCRRTAHKPFAGPQYAKLVPDELSKSVAGCQVGGPCRLSPAVVSGVRHEVPAATVSHLGI